MANVTHSDWYQEVWQRLDI